MISGDKLYMAVLPVLIFWGIIWIIMGFRMKKMKDKEK
jgi:hypothetical protein